MTAKERLEEWYKDVNACTLREVKSVRDTIKYYEDEILNYFIKVSVSAIAYCSCNSKYVSLHPNNKSKICVKLQVNVMNML